ncbi:MAG: sugar phosphate isomerase/epimerase [Planctomycetaceae bacterium]|nr:sugar phosphate isomerase/epimerase [Planctomycetaceae bacterium]
MLGTAAAGVALSLAGSQVTSAQPQAEAPASGPLRLKKAVKIGMIGGEAKDLPLAEKFSLLKRIGYDGVELDSPNKLDAKEVLDAIDKAGLPVHGVVDSVHWSQTLSDADPAVRKKGLEGLQTALRDAKAYGATTVLLVPAVVSKQVSYADAYIRSQAEIRKAIPLAEELGIKILFENVWNNFLLSPLETARYIDEFESPFTGAYFDVGNIVRYGWPQHWVAALGTRIGKLDIKEFSRDKMNNEGLWKGFDVEIGDGDCDWPEVRAELKKIGFVDGWATAEVGGGGEERLTNILERMRKVLDA